MADELILLQVADITLWLSSKMILLNSNEPAKSTVRAARHGESAVRFPEVVVDQGKLSGCSRTSLNRLNNQDPGRTKQVVGGLVPVDILQAHML